MIYFRRKQEPHGGRKELICQESKSAPIHLWIFWRSLGPLQERDKGNERAAKESSPLSPWKPRFLSSRKESEIERKWGGGGLMFLVIKCVRTQNIKRNGRI